MNLNDLPKSKDADICLILEGSFPFVKGGVSHWASELIRVFPQYRFAVIFLGTREEDYEELQYPLTQNLVHLEVRFIFEHNKEPGKHSNKDIDPKTREQIKVMHDHFKTILSDKSQSTCEYYDLMFESEKLNESLFLRSKSAWNMITETYLKRYPEQSFFDYFWSVRNIHRPFWALANIVKDIPRVKVLHSATTGYAGFLGALLQNKYRIPYVITEHGIYTKERWIDLMRNYFFESVMVSGRQLTQEKDLLNLWVNFFSILAKIGYDAADPIISLFEGYRERQISDGAIPERTRIISYGTDFNRFQFLGKKKPNLAKPIIACVGRVVPIKDIKTFIRTCALIMKQIPEAEAWIVGAELEESDYVETCKNLAQILGLKDKIKFLGEQNTKDIYPKIDLLVLCSISEGTPFVILESFAVGIPVVATDVGACRELIYGKNSEDRLLGQAGRLVNIADPHALALAAVELLTDVSLWQTAQEVGLKRVKTYYSMDAFIENYSFIYQEAMTNGRNRI